MRSPILIKTLSTTNANPSGTSPPWAGRIQQHLLSLNANANSLSLCSRSSPPSRLPNVLSSSPPLLLPPRGSNIGAHRALIVGVQNIGTLRYLLFAFLASLPSPLPSPSMQAFPHPERTNFRIHPPPPPSLSLSLLSPGPSTRSSPSSLNSIRSRDVQVRPPLPEAQRRRRLPRDVEPAQPGSHLDE